MRALIAVERGHILDAKVIDLKTNSDVIEIPITPDMAPNAFVSVVIVKGVDQNELAPSFKLGYAAFTVNREQQLLKVTLTPDPRRERGGENYAPRTPVSYTLKVLDFQGKPVQAEVSLALVDLSVLTLLDPFASPMPDFYYGERGLGVMTSASLVYSVDRINLKLSEEAKGGGGGAAEGGDFFVRGNFPDTAYWNATVTTDANGEAKISAVLPDNLTTWRMLAKAVTKDTLVGEGQVDIRSTKDLLIRPVTPRFMVVGDKLTMAAVVNNNTAKAIEAEVVNGRHGPHNRQRTNQADGDGSREWTGARRMARHGARCALCESHVHGAGRRPGRCEQAHRRSAAGAVSADLQIQHARNDGDRGQCQQG